MESQPQNAELDGLNKLSDLFSVCIKTIDHFNLKLLLL